MSKLFLFPTVLEHKIIEKNTDQLKNNTIFVPSRDRGENFKRDFNSLNRFPRVKNIILEEFKNFAESLGYGRDFKISSSWFTSTQPGDDGTLHNHQNSFYSAIYYYDEYDENSGDILFENPCLRNLSLFVVPNKFDATNSHSWHFTPERRLIIFFPSYLFHKIETNKSDKTRYSLAVNFIPSKGFGMHDSHINLI
tara:strand:- start:64 stop:648 length:585 start_codon:yes stop_codon:yes gene_type:complete